MTFHHDAPNSHVPGISVLEFLGHALSITSYHNWQWICKACLQKPYCICIKFPLFIGKKYLILLLIINEWKYNTNLKIHNIKVSWSACEITLLLSPAVCMLCSLFLKQGFTRNFYVLSNNCQKPDNIRTGTEIVNPCYCCP